MKLFSKILTWTAVGLAGVAGMLPIAGQLGVFQGTAPTDLGVKDGRLKAPSLTPNSVSSQADLFADHPQRAYAQIAALQFPDKAKTDMTTVAQAVQALGGCQIIKQDSKPDASYLYAQCRTVWLGFVDDLELWDNPAQQRIEVRSASRLGRKDFGVNRARVESLRTRLGGFAAGDQK